MKPIDWTRVWSLQLLEAIPVPGLATAATWQGTVPGTSRAPGKNHPEAGAWLVHQYCPPMGICVDPMAGSGGLWVKVQRQRVGSLYACEIEESLYSLCSQNLKLKNFGSSSVACSDAREWKPAKKANLVLFSPPFLQNHSSGATEHQRNIRERKSLHTMQEFGTHPDNLGRKKAVEFWQGMSSVYSSVSKYLNPTGYAIVILRNRIRHGQEIDEIGRHISLMHQEGLKPIGAHVRDLVRPTGYQAWKLARNPNLPWIRYEWAIVSRLC